MSNKLIKDINNYISYLNDNGLYVSVHGKMISGLLAHNLHKNPFCIFVKTMTKFLKNHQASLRLNIALKMKISNKKAQAPMPELL